MPTIGEEAGSMGMARLLERICAMEKPPTL